MTRAALVLFAIVTPLIALLSPLTIAAVFAGLGAVPPLAGLAFVAATVETPTLLAIIAGIFGPLGAYLVAARQFSGKIETTEARELWEESRSIRDWSQQRIEVLHETVERLERRLRELEDENSDLRRRLAATMGG